MKASFQKFFEVQNNKKIIIFDWFTTSVWYWKFHDIPIISQGEHDDSDDDSDNDLQSFIHNQESCHTLMVDVNEAYDVYTDAYEFLQKKRHLSTEAT